ncbi:hypothetical protein [Croceicoccus hydrothermalis]|uniref:hypothetical protein n=1 Tax=Croceicoccus hydrothermalis TaxID=2867964 RepID=UPI001EFB6D8F|nr:hypothetical protein [Croceicoccus hydrothermalis]
MTQRDPKPEQKNKKLSNTGVEEPLTGVIESRADEARNIAEKIKRDDEEVKKYVNERRDSIRRGARRSRNRFRF